MNKQKTTNQLILILLTAITILMSIQTVNAWELWGYEWDVGDYEPLYYTEYVSYSEIDTAISDWNAMDVDPDYEEDESGLDTLLWIYEVYLPTKSWVGLCTAYHSGPIFDYVEIRINDYWVQTYLTGMKRSLINHELGHSLGLNHEQDIWVIMHQGVIDRYNHGILTPQDDDEDGVQEIYGGD